MSFAPVQGFIEKSRKLRDLYGASLILSYLSQKIIQELQDEFPVISPGLIHIQEGMPNRILVQGFVDRDRVKNSLLKHWQHLLKVCREWVERHVPAEYHWSQTAEQVGKEKGEWERWGSYAWEVFWGTGSDPQAAMADLEARKLKRGWTAINWIGESSSLSGTDAIAWPRLGEKRNLRTELTIHERQLRKQELEDFYLKLSQVLEEDSSSDLPQGKFLRPNERLSIPELVKRLVTRYDGIGEHLSEEFRIDSFSEMVRLPEPEQPGHWTGWFMGDGDQVGQHLKSLQTDTELTQFSQAMRDWGLDFGKKFPKDLGRVVYAGGDDFMGVIYSENPKAPISEKQALKWLTSVNQQWQTHGQNVTLSLGFVWAGHSVPQRDVLQHCREAEKLAKNKGRDRVTIRVLFNSGQYVQWTCPWDYLHVLQNYRDRDGNTWNDKYLNWTHIYNDWEHLKARHAIPLKDKAENIDERIALELFELYFGDRSPRTDSLRPVSRNYFSEADNCKHITGKAYSATAIIEWIDGLVKVGWQLCSNS